MDFFKIVICLEVAYNFTLLRSRNCKNKSADNDLISLTKLVERVHVFATDGL